MRRPFIFLIICLLALGLATGFYLINDRDGQYIPALQVTGDVENALHLKSREGLTEAAVEYKGQELKAVRLKELVEKAGPLTADYGLVLVGSDGLSARLSGKSLEGCYLNFSGSNGWEAVNLFHPVSSNIKHLREIIVYAEGNLPERALRVINREENLKAVTAGQLLRDGVRIKPYFEGSSSLEAGGGEYQSSIYTRKRVVMLEDLTESISGNGSRKRTLIFGAEGKTTVFDRGYLEIRANMIDYFDPESDSRIEDVRGIIFNTPVVSNCDAYHDALYYLEQGRRVLIVMLDGFGFHQYEEALKRGAVPFLQSIQPARKALSVYQPVTNAGLAAVLTGSGPAVNGVYSRKQKELKSNDIFKEAEKLGKTAVYIEGNIKILNTSLEPELNPDKNGNGTTDDEVFQSALTAIKEGNSLVFVHFHGIDDTGHQYGDLAAETMERISKTDEFLKSLTGNWSGKVIITADHGMHQVEGGGEHGLVCYQDMFVPYLITDGGGSE